MRNRLVALSVMSSLCLFLSLPLFAHHGNAAFDSVSRVTIKGAVVGWLWANPHCVLTLDVNDDKGQTVRWAVEATDPASMGRGGWSRTTFTPGDVISVTLMPAKNGRPIGRIDNVVLPNGQTLKSGLAPDSPTEKPKAY